MGNEFIFPFTTCEKPHDGPIKQPMSALINAISAIILLAFTLSAKTYPVMIMFLAFFSFEVFHTFSHMYHIPGQFQTIIIHILGYSISVTTLISILYLSKTPLTYYLIGILITLISIDIYILFYVKDIWTVISGLTILLLVFFISYTKLPRFFQKNLWYLVIGLFLLYGLIYNETMNCAKMLNYAIFPYHIFIEILGLMLFTYLSYNFLRWEREIVKK
jgi:hypothetical protein